MQGLKVWVYSKGGEKPWGDFEQRVTDYPIHVSEDSSPVWREDRGGGEAVPLGGSHTRLGRRKRSPGLNADGGGQEGQTWVGLKLKGLADGLGGSSQWVINNPHRSPRRWIVLIGPILLTRNQALRG